VNCGGSGVAKTQFGPFLVWCQVVGFSSTAGRANRDAVTGKVQKFKMREAAVGELGPEKASGVRTA